ncbi:MAG: GNAT family N-acetyltransferase [Clostridiales bacterium]|nr:GNAT family N-acetyltransferase [Clostridiales bacterium]
MKILDDIDYRVEREVLLDAVNFQGGKLIVHDENAAIVDMGDWYKCAFRTASAFAAHKASLRKGNEACVMGANSLDPAEFGIGSLETPPCKSFAYLGAMPPELDLPRGVVIKRLAPSLAETVAKAYNHNPVGYSPERMAEIMRTMGVFGAIADGKLAGFIGRHKEGSMGMLEVFEAFRRKGIASALEKFMIGYVMTFGRTPFCDVFADNAASLALQDKLGMTASNFYTFWLEIE